MSSVRHVLGISGGKDSAALAIYLKNLYPTLDIQYYTSDTGKELSETYQLIDRLQSFLHTEITILKGADGNELAPFDHFLDMYKGYLPSSSSRWCTKKLKLEPFEKFVGNDLVVSYVGIRGDEDREGYISRKSNIQSIFPFRKNIWSEDVIAKFLANSNIELACDLALQNSSDKSDRLINTLKKEVMPSFTAQNKLSQLLNIGVKETNRLIFSFLKSTTYPLASVDQFPLVENEEVLVLSDIYRLLEESGVGIPAYYNRNNEYSFSYNGKMYQYARSRSGCYFCFFQQKIEWVWLLENHPNLFEKAVQYEKDGYSWNQDETLQELRRSHRVNQIKADYIKRVERLERSKGDHSQGGMLMDVLADDGAGCASCFI